VTTAPDIAGFDQAQRRLRAALGVEATFHVPGVPTWPEGTALDPETGRPVDSFVRPVSTTAVDVTLKCSFVTRPLSRLLQPEREEAPLGWVGSDSAALIMSPEDHASVATAEYVTVGDQRYLVSFREDQTSTVRRTVAFLRLA
jgi:hypothetical protein